MPLLQKEIIAPDDYHTAEGVVRATPARIRHWLQQFRKMKKKGLPVPVPWEHQEGAKPVSHADLLANEAKHNAGWVKDMFLDRKGHLWGVLDVPDAADAQRVKTSVRYVSPEIDDHWEDGDGQEWDDIITHVALTPRPVFHRQKPFGAKAQLSHPARGVVWLSMSDRVHNTRVKHMAEYDDDTDDQTDDTDTGDQGDDAASGSDLLQEACDLLDSKFGLHLPTEHIDESSFLRDLVMALHGHPGHDLGEQDQDADQMSEDDEDVDADAGAGDSSTPREEQPTAMMSGRNRRRRKLSARSRVPQRMTAARGKAAAQEQLRNAKIIK